jgi:DNA primase
MGQDSDDRRPRLAEVVRALGFEAEPIEALGDAGGWRSVRCSFHEDRTASASCNVALGAFTCHACGVSGDSWSLIMKFKNVDFKAAVEWATKNVGYQHAFSPRKEASQKPYVSPWAASNDF